MKEAEVSEDKMLFLWSVLLRVTAVKVWVEAVREVELSDDTEEKC